MQTMFLNDFDLEFGVFKGEPLNVRGVRDRRSLSLNGRAAG